MKKDTMKTKRLFKAATAIVLAFLLAFTPVTDIPLLRDLGFHLYVYATDLNCELQDGSTTYTLNVEPSERIESVKEKLRVKAGLSPDEIYLMFDGKVLEDGYTLEDYSVPMNGTIIIVKKENTYTITFDANGGSGTMESVEAKADNAYTLPSCGFTAPEGKEFDCWAIGSATGTKKNAGDTITPTDDTTLYAIWNTAESEQPAEDKKPITNTTPVKADNGSQVTTADNGTATLTTAAPSNKKSVSVPSSVNVDGVTYDITEIGANAFKNLKKATTVTLPKTVKKIKANAFAGSKVSNVKLTVGKGQKLTVDKKAFKKSKVQKIQITVSKKATDKEINTIKKALKKAGIKEGNIKISKKLK